MSGIEGIDVAVVLLVDLDSDPNRPDFFKFERGLLTDQFSFIPGATRFVFNALVRQTFVEWGGTKKAVCFTYLPGTLSPEVK